VYYAKPDAARAACHALGDQCDYPILVGKSPHVACEGMWLKM
jgi:hypothetical protein